MLKLRINPIVAMDLKNIRNYIAEDNEKNDATAIPPALDGGLR